MVSRAAAVLLLIMYGCLLVFVLYTHKDQIEDANKQALKPEAEREDEEDEELLEDEEKPETKAINQTGEITSLEKLSSLKSIKEEEEDDDELEMSILGSMTLLCVCTVFVAVLSEFLVGSIEPMSTSAGMGEPFVGMILLPIIGNAVEHITAVRMARKGKMDISLSIAIGSATQVAMFVVGLSVIVGWILDVNMALDFPPFEVQMFIYTSIILFALVSDGTSTWLEGAMLLCLYALIAVAVWDQ